MAHATLSNTSGVSWRGCLLLFFLNYRITASRHLFDFWSRLSILPPDTVAGVVYSLSSRVLLFSLLPPPIITHGTRFSPAISLHNTHTSNSPIVLSLSLSLSCITLVHTVERPVKMNTPSHASPVKDGRRVLGEKPANACLSPAARRRSVDAAAAISPLKRPSTEYTPSSSPTKKKQLLPSPPFTGQKRGIDQVEQQEQQQDQENVGGGSWRMLEVFKSGERVSLALRGCLHRIA